jgi:hypothetical protein
MKIDQLFPTRYATGADLAGKSYTFTVAGVALEQMHSQPGKPAEEKPVLYFKETKKGIVLTRPLAMQIAEILRSTDTDEWTGKKVTIFPQPLTVAGQPRVAIRAKAPTNGTDTPPLSLMDEEEE